MISNNTSCQSFFAAVSLYLLIALYSNTVFASEALIDINSESAEQLAHKLSGIGPTKGQAIVAYRELHGPFKAVDELIEVKGIGPRTLEKIRVYLTVNATDRLNLAHDAVAAIASGSPRSAAQAEQVTRRAVRAVIGAARHNSTLSRR